MLATGRDQAAHGRGEVVGDLAACGRLLVNSGIVDEVRVVLETGFGVVARVGRGGHAAISVVFVVDFMD